MTKTSMLSALPLVQLVLVAACGSDSSDSVLAPRAQSVASYESHWSAWSEPVNLGPVVNTAGLDQNPALSPDGLSLYFESERAGGFGIWVSHRACADCPWEAAVRLDVINNPGGAGGPALSRDGHLLFFSSARPGGHGSDDIYMVRRADPKDDFGWGPPVNLGPDVNTAAFEANPDYLQLAADETANLYFNRGPGPGQFDIYAARVTRRGEGSNPAVLVSELSLPGVNDGSPTVRADGKELIFHSGRPGGVGRGDLWMSTRRNAHEAWSTPENVGAPVNTSSADIQAALSRDGRTLLFASDRPGGNGGMDLWMSTRVRVNADDDQDDDGEDDKDT